MIKNKKKLVAISTLGLGGMMLVGPTILAINENNTITMNIGSTRESLRTTTPNNKGLNITNLSSGFNFVDTSLNGSDFDPLPLSSSFSAQTVRTQTHLINFDKVINTQTTKAISLNLITGEKTITLIPTVLIGSIITIGDFIILAGSEPRLNPGDIIVPKIFILSIAPISGSIFIIAEIKVPVDVTNNFNQDFGSFPIAISPITSINNSASIEKILIFQNGLSLEATELNTFIGTITNQGDLAIEHTRNIIKSVPNFPVSSLILALNVIEGKTPGTYNVIVFLKNGNEMNALHFNRRVSGDSSEVNLISSPKLETNPGVAIEIRELLELIPYARTQILNDKVQILWILPSTSNSFVYSIEFIPSGDKDNGELVVDMKRTINLSELGFNIIIQQFYGAGGSFEDNNINISLNYIDAAGEKLALLNWQNPTDITKWSQKVFEGKESPIASILTSSIDPTILQKPIILNFNEEIIISANGTPNLEGSIQTYVARMKVLNDSNGRKLDVNYNTRIPLVITLANGVLIPKNWRDQGQAWVKRLITVTSDDLFGPIQFDIDGNYFSSSIQSVELDEDNPIDTANELNLQVTLTSHWENGIRKGQIVPPGEATIFKATILSPTAESISTPIVSNPSKVTMWTKASSFGEGVIAELNDSKINGSFPPNWPGIPGVIGSSKGDLIQINESYFPYLINATFNANDFTGTLSLNFFFQNGESTESVLISIDGFQDLRIIIGSSVGAVAIIIGIVIALSTVLIRAKAKNKLSKALTAGFGLAQHFSASQETKKDIKFKENDQLPNKKLKPNQTIIKPQTPSQNLGIKKLQTPQKNTKKPTLPKKN